VSRDHAETRLDGLTGDAYLLDHYHVVASGGSSGVRGVFLFDWDGWLMCALTNIRFRARARPLWDRTQRCAGVIAGGKASHMGYAMAQTFSRSMGSLPATLPIHEMVARLNALQPAILSGYPSSLFSFASDARKGRLSIHPRLVMCASEPLLPEMHHRIEDVWSFRVINSYFTSEGASASDCGAGRGG